MKRASANYDQSHSADDGKLKYQTLLREYLELQKECVARKRKLQAAKQKREVTLAEVRFLRSKHKYLLKSQAPNEAKKPSTLQDGRNPSTITRLPKDDKAEEGSDHVYKEDVRCKKKKRIKNHLIDENKVEGKSLIKSL